MEFMHFVPAQQFDRIPVGEATELDADELFVTLFKHQAPALAEERSSFDD